MRSTQTHKLLSGHTHSLGYESQQHTHTIAFGDLTHSYSGDPKHTHAHTHTHTHAHAHTHTRTCAHTHTLLSGDSYTTVYISPVGERERKPFVFQNRSK